MLDGGMEWKVSEGAYKGEESASSNRRCIVYFSKGFPPLVLRKVPKGYKNVKSESIIYKRNGQGKDQGC